VGGLLFVSPDGEPLIQQQPGRRKPAACHQLEPIT
jgi:hypothetical protein